MFNVRVDDAQRLFCARRCRYGRANLYHTHTHTHIVIVWVACRGIGLVNLSVSLYVIVYFVCSAFVLHPHTDRPTHTLMHNDIFMLLNPKKITKHTHLHRKWRTHHKHIAHHHLQQIIATQRNEQKIIWILYISCTARGFYTRIDESAVR